MRVLGHESDRHAVNHLNFGGKKRAVKTIDSCVYTIRWYHRDLLTHKERIMSPVKKILEVAVTGAAGQIGYGLLFRIANGDMFGSKQPVRLRLLERDDPKALAALEGLAMELDDGAFPLLAGVVRTADPMVAFDGADAALLIGGKPRGPGQERRDVLLVNAEIYKLQGEALAQVANPGCKTLVVGNPANTNCYVAMNAAVRMGARAENFQALMRLDHNRAVSRVASEAGVGAAQVEGVFVWGNHSNAMFPDLSQARVNNMPALSLLNEKWVNDSFVNEVARRGTAIIEARGLSSAASAAHAAIEQMRDWWMGAPGQLMTVGMRSDGSYGVPEGLVFGFPAVYEASGVKIVQGLPVSAAARAGIQASIAELSEERLAADEALGEPSAAAPKSPKA